MLTHKLQRIEITSNSIFRSCSTWYHGLSPRLFLAQERRTALHPNLRSQVLVPGHYLQIHDTLLSSLPFPGVL